MKPFRTFILAAARAVVSGAAAARASVVVEHINTIATSFAPWEEFFPNEYDPFHPKQLRFVGVATGGGDPRAFPGTLWVQFDWVDPVLGVIYSPAWPVFVAYTPALTIIDVSWTIPFCPEQVSLHFATDVPDGGVVNFGGISPTSALFPSRGHTPWSPRWAWRASPSGDDAASSSGEVAAFTELSERRRPHAALR